jgi:pantoate--beta-alanine ligase
MNTVRDVGPQEAELAPGPDVDLPMTTVVESITEWRRERVNQIRAGRTLGVVPTMGALHDGHLSLVRRSRAENALTLVTIFVNSTQFDDPHDLANYPRRLAEDLELLKSVGANFVLCPSESDLYPDAYDYRVTELALSRVLEGAHRPGHFDGVLTVVLKLLQIAAADRAYFGEKDWQQLRLVQGMARAFFLPTDIVACATVRERDGLALSSRNRRLHAADRERAPAFHRILSSAPTADDARRELRSLGFAVDYVEEREGRRLGAVRLGDVRLIDNVCLTSTGLDHEPAPE